MRESRIKMIVAVAVIVIVLTATLVALAARGAQLRAEMSFSTSNAGPTIGAISVFGHIHNDGFRAGNGTVELHVFDGIEWHDYSVPTGRVPARGSVDFLWGEIFDPMNRDEVAVEYELKRS